jgi:hypothetical protein
VVAVVVVVGGVVVVVADVMVPILAARHRGHPRGRRAGGAGSRAACGDPRRTGASDGHGRHAGGYTRREESGPWPRLDAHGA